MASLLVFFVFALQCLSTIAVMRRETNSWRWPCFAFGYLLALAWLASFATHRLVSALASSRYTAPVVLRHRITLLCLLAVVAGAAGCRTPIREDVYEQPPVKVFLRSEKSWQFGPLIEKDYDHPVTISPVRMAHILSRVDARIAGKREPAIETDMLYPIAEGISRALTRAGAEQEVVVMAIRKQRHFGVFDHDFLTSFVVYVRGPQLFIHLARLNWEIPVRQEDKPPEPGIDEEKMSFRVYASEAMELVGKQSVAVNFKDEIFTRATRTKILPERRVVRCRR